MKVTMGVGGILLLLLAAGCACGGPGENQRPGDDDDGPGECSDTDGDEYGSGPGCLGDDCDDSNPAVWDEAQCEALCAEDAHATGCPCDSAQNPEPEICYAGPAETLGVGGCRAGLRTCDGGAWSECAGQVLPDVEICNEADDDCDAEVDEGVTNECGGCGECEETCVGAGEGCTGWDVVNEGNGVQDCEGEDCITLGGQTISLEVAWIANSSQGTVSKVNTRTYEEEGRYRTGPDAMGGGLSPSRTSVDFRGDVVVGNRHFGSTPSITKIQSADCDERGDGRVDTSTGRDDVLPWAAADDWEDDCIAWRTEIGNNGSITRAVAVQDRVGLDGVLDEVVWAGRYTDHMYVEVNRQTGEETGVEVDISPCTPYGAAIDRDGNLWSSGLWSRNVARFDTADPADVEVIPEDTGYTYGITVDESGIVWFGGTSQMYDPGTGEFTRLAANGQGIAADGEGSIWVGTTPVWRVDADTLEAHQIAGTSGYGMAVAFDGKVWAVPMSGSVDVIDPADESFERILDDCAGGFGAGCLTGPYTYSDMTGFQLRNATDPFGEYAHVFEACAEGSDWSAITFDANVPAGTSIEWSVRTGATLEDVAAAAWQVVGTAPPDASPLALPDTVESSQFIEVKVRLASLNREDKPRVYSFGLQFSCDDPFG